MSLLQAEIQPLEIDLRRTAVLVVDMQNAFVSKGGMFDLLGFDVSASQNIIETIEGINNTARAKGIKVINIAHRYSASPLEIDEASPYWQKADQRSYREHPEWRDKMLIRGTWGAEFIENLKPQESDLIVEKPRFSAFAGTNLDTILRAHDIKYVAFTGVTTNICVQSTLRDAFHLDYFCILISDATATPNPQHVQETVENDVKSCFGWVTNSENLIKAMK
jgi:ureidoacrylate peracid hydrolase